MIDEYKLYACVILTFSIISVLVTLYEIKSNTRKLKEFSFYETKINSFRQLNKIMIELNYDTKLLETNENISSYKTPLSSGDLIPGDISNIY